ncbi:hypothetical protein KKF29_02305, partial [Patescibacteria group bacterium]|nr:hypothetical protein [Patescibacteria group bacterium]
MKKKAELFFGVILVPIDFLMLVIAGFAAYFLRFGEAVSGYVPVIYEMPWTDFALIIFGSSIAMQIIFAIAGLYNLKGTRRIVDEFRKIFFACSTGVMIIIILTFFDRELFSSRFIILMAWVFSIAFVSLARLAVLYIQRKLFEKGIGLQKVVLVGEGNISRALEREIKINKGLGMQIVERC